MGYINKSIRDEITMDNKQDKKLRILHGATELFLRYGYSKTSLDEIAQKAGFGKATIYHYFPNKEDIFLSVLECKCSELFIDLRKIIAQVDRFEDKIAVFIRTPVKLMYEHLPMMLEGLNQLNYSYQSRVMEFGQSVRCRMSELLSEILDQGNKQGMIAEFLEPSKFVQIVYDWLLLGDPNVTINNPRELVKKVDEDNETITQIVLYGIIKRGNQ